MCEGRELHALKLYMRTQVNTLHYVNNMFPRIEKELFMQEAAL